MVLSNSDTACHVSYKLLHITVSVSFDDSAANDRITIIENNSLSRTNRALGSIEDDFKFALRTLRHRGVGRGVS